MNKYQEKIKALFEKMESIRLNAEKENRAMSADEIQNRTDIKVEIDAVKAEWDSVEAELKMKAELFGDGSSNRKVVADPNDRIKVEAKPIYNSLGEQLLDVAKAAQPGYSKETRDATERLQKVVAATGSSESIPSDGGFLVQQEFSTDLNKGVLETGILAKKCFQIPLSGNTNGIKLNLMDETNRANGSRFGGIRVYRTDEGGTTTKSKPKLRQWELNLAKLMAVYYATDEILADASALQSVVSQWFVKEFRFKVDDEIVNGTGVGQCLGWLSAGAKITVTAETGQGAATIVPENIIKMYTRFMGTNGAWYINRDVIPQLYLMSQAVGTGGVPVFMPANSMANQPYNTLLGLPIIEIEQAATLGTEGDISLCDLSNEYGLITKGGINAAASIHVQFLTDEMTFRWVYRINGKPFRASPLTPYKGTGNTRSPFVTLSSTRT